LGLFAQGAEGVTAHKITEDQITLLDLSGLHRRAPFLIDGVLNSQFSITRFYGGIRFNGEHYTYLPGADQLVRDDVLAWLKKNRSKQGKLTEPKNTQARIFDEPD
jgi:hypothetical protein